MPRFRVVLPLLIALLAACGEQSLTGPERAAPPSVSAVLIEPRTVAQVSAGYQSTCALRTDRTVACWGDNSYGAATPPSGTLAQVDAGQFLSCGLRGDGTIACWGLASLVSTLPAGRFREASVGRSHACALKEDSTLACWGSDYFHQATPPAGTFLQVSAGGDVSCGLRTDHTVVCWGYGRLARQQPAGNFTSVSAGDDHACGLTIGGEAICWPYGFSGEAFPPAGSFTKISAGAGYACALRAEGTLACWGYNDFVLPSTPSGTFVQVSAGPKHACATTVDGTLTCWGDDSWGDATPPRGHLTQVSAATDHACSLTTEGTVQCWGGVGAWSQEAPPAGTFTQVSAGYQLTCALSTDGTLSCWGDRRRGPATSPSGRFEQVSVGGASTCAVRADGVVACWGSDAVAQSTPPAGRFAQVSVGTYHACATATDGVIVCWGDDQWGRATPPSDGRFVQVSAGFGHACAVTTGSTLVCWGNNDRGQATPPAGQFLQVVAGDYYACALSATGTVACWGENSHGESTPPGGHFTQLSAGGSYACALAEDQSIACWGSYAVAESPPTSNRPPVARVGGPYTGVEGALVHFDGRASSDPEQKPLRVAWKFGDGTTGEGPTPANGYADQGTYTVELTVTDEGGLSQSANTTATIANAPPTAAFSTTGPVNEGSAYELRLAAATDPSPVDRAAGFAYAFDCGDGAGYHDVAGTPTSAERSCPTTDDGARTVRARLTDKDGGASEYAAQVVVRNVAPTVASFPGATIMSGESYSGAASFADPGEDSWSAMVDYGDGQGAQPLPLHGTSFALGYQYRSAGSRTLLVTVRDDDGGVGTARATVVVLSPEQAVTRLISDVADLVARRALADGAAKPLVTSLQSARRQLEMARARQALPHIVNFTRRVVLLVVTRRLATADAGPLLRYVSRIAASMASSEGIVAQRLDELAPTAGSSAVARARLEDDRKQ